MPIAYSYLRLSTPKQNKGDSVRRQLELAQKYAEQNNLILDETLQLFDLGGLPLRGGTPPQEN
jgi:hypothetical protein